MSKQLPFILSMLGVGIALSACAAMVGKVPLAATNRSEDRWLRSTSNESAASIRQIAIFCGWNMMRYDDVPRVQKCMVGKGIESSKDVRKAMEECGYMKRVEIAVRQQCMLDKGYIYMDDPIQPFCDLGSSSRDINKYPACRSLPHP